jgi:ketosteroid isomerase-like protein
VIGAEAVSSRYRDDAQAFEGAGESRFEIVQKSVGGDLSFWTGWQVATVRLPGQDVPTVMRIRVTEVFRRASGVWQLVHRHADVLAK